MQQYSSINFNQPSLSPNSVEKTITENFCAKHEIIQRSKRPTPLRKYLYLKHIYILFFFELKRFILLKSIFLGSLNRIPQKLETQHTKPSHTITLGDNSVLS